MHGEESRDGARAEDGGAAEAQRGRTRPSRKGRRIVMVSISL